MEQITVGLLSIALGVIALLSRGNLHLFTAAAGFLIGWVLAQQIIPGALPVTLTVAVVLALTGVVLVALVRGGIQVVLQIVSAVAGAGVLLWLSQSLSTPSGLTPWVIALVGALIGFGLTARLFKLGITILTVLLGASLILHGLSLLFNALPSVVGTVIVASC